ncbi:VOC family protein [Shewanella sp. D64]|uniref:VOC family protein n=1 Tax=unclassified Shewanella TaxID=196818 RepID=UPI0022BA43AB|nr:MULTISPECIES: VOC family protein [unclassified Shewanella]MEC4727300.1 VOC family protein [Shewanella sp. D64]MEC4739455.1 VOC family protein [Shewanella sp. E94]WBJ96784.1 VOC family protein [Shewanella sp. MTB7]
MIHLEHLNLVVTDIPTTLTFYQAAFPHWNVRGGGESNWHGKDRNWVHFGDDYQYLTFNDDGVGVNRDLTGHQLGLAHFAFVTSDLDGVIARLAEAGFVVDKEGAVDEFRQNVYYIDPDGYEIEFVQYLSDTPWQRNRYD